MDTSTSTLRGRRGTYGIGLAPAARLVLRCRRGRCGFLRGRRGTCTLRGRRGTLRHPPSFHVAGAVFGHIDFHFAWQAWHVWHRAGSGGALGSQVSPWALRLFAWQAWHLHFAWQAWHAETSTFVSRGRCGIWTHRLPLCVAGVYGSGLALVARLVLRCRRGRRGFLRGRNLYMTHPLL